MRVSDPCDTVDGTQWGLGCVFLVYDNISRDICLACRARYGEVWYNFNLTQGIKISGDAAERRHD